MKSRDNSVQNENNNNEQTININNQSDGDGDSEGDAYGDDHNNQCKVKRKNVECIMGDFSDEQLRNMHPQRSTFEFNLNKSKVVITSNFDAGNMARCEQMESGNNFNIWVSSDSMPYYKYTGFRTWFYFGIKGVERGKYVHFHIKNMNFQRSLYASGLKPFFRVGKEGKFKRITGKVTWNNGQDGLQIHFDHQMSYKDSEQLTYFSFVEPWGYEDNLSYFSNYQQKIKKSQRMSEEIYFHRELLGYSKELRYLELITITGKSHNSKEREDKIEADGIFPAIEEGSEESKIFSLKRSYKFDKPTVFLSARVHPGEIQSSHVLNGIVDFLLSKSDQASILLEKYVFKIIPLLNPDGVARGYYRLDTHNHNLNRFYTNPCQKEQPTIFYAKKAVVQQHQYGNLKIYIDLHGHASKKGCFIFGNNLKGDQQALNMLFPRLISLNSLNFDFQECSFSEKLMTVKDAGNQLSREGSGRVGIFMATGIVHSYTLECHYQTGRRLNVLSQKYNSDTGEIEPEDVATDRNSRIYKDTRNPNYTVEIFEDIGRAVCIALLELGECNPISRMPTSYYKNTESVRKELIVQNSLLPYEQMKEIRKEVQKEREIMKTKQQKLMTQIQQKLANEAKKAAKQKEKEEKAEEKEKQKQEKGGADQKSKNKESKKQKIRPSKLQISNENEVGVNQGQDLATPIEKISVAQIRQQGSPLSACHNAMGGGPESPILKRLKHNLQKSLKKHAQLMDRVQQSAFDNSIFHINGGKNKSNRQDSITVKSAINIQKDGQTLNNEQNTFLTEDFSKMQLHNDILNNEMLLMKKRMHDQMTERDLIIAKQEGAQKRRGESIPQRQLKDMKQVNRQHNQTSDYRNSQIDIHTNIFQNFQQTNPLANENESRKPNYEQLQKKAMDGENIHKTQPFEFRKSSNILAQAGNQQLYDSYEMLQHSNSMIPQSYMHPFTCLQNPLKQKTFAAKNYSEFENENNQNLNLKIIGVNNNMMQQTYEETTLDYIQNNKWNMSSEQTKLLISQDKNIKFHSKIKDASEQTKQKLIGGAKLGSSIYKQNSNIIQNSSRLATQHLTKSTNAKVRISTASGEVSQQNPSSTLNALENERSNQIKQSKAFISQNKNQSVNSSSAIRSSYVNVAQSILQDSQQTYNEIHKFQKLESVTNPISQQFSNRINSNIFDQKSEKSQVQLSNRNSLNLLSSKEQNRITELNLQVQGTFIKQVEIQSYQNEVQQSSNLSKKQKAQLLNNFRHNEEGGSRQQNKRMSENANSTQLSKLNDSKNQINKRLGKNSVIKNSVLADLNRQNTLQLQNEQNLKKSNFQFLDKHTEHELDKQQKSQQIEFNSFNESKWKRGDRQDEKLKIQNQTNKTTEDQSVSSYMGIHNPLKNKKVSNNQVNKGLLTFEEYSEYLKSQNIKNINQDSNFSKPEGSQTLVPLNQHQNSQYTSPQSSINLGQNQIGVLGHQQNLSTLNLQQQKKSQPPSVRMMGKLHALSGAFNQIMPDKQINSSTPITHYPINHKPSQDLNQFQYLTHFQNDRDQSLNDPDKLIKRIETQNQLKNKFPTNTSQAQEEPSIKKQNKDGSRKQIHTRNLSSSQTVCQQKSGALQSQNIDNERSRCGVSSSSQRTKDEKNEFYSKFLKKDFSNQQLLRKSNKEKAYLEARIHNLSNSILNRKINQKFVNKQQQKSHLTSGAGENQVVIQFQKQTNYLSPNQQKKYQNDFQKSYLSKNGGIVMKNQLQMRHAADAAE